MDRKERVKELLARAWGLGEAERGEMLSRECGGDAALRREVEDLLAAGEHSPHLAGVFAFRVGADDETLGKVTEIVLDRGLFERRIFPAMNIGQTGTRKEEKLLPPTVLPKIHTLRRALAGTDPMTAMKMLLERLQKFPNNEAFLKSF